MLKHLRTVRHLRPRQLYYLFVRRLSRALQLSRPREVSFRPAWESLRAIEALQIAAVEPSSSDVRASADAAVRGEFTFLSETRVLPEIDWNIRHGSPLWSFNLQYCGYSEDLARTFRNTGSQEYLETMQRLTRSWVEQSKPARSDAWAPFAVAQRLIHWTRAIALTHAYLSDDHMQLWLRSIAQQTDFLARNIEWELSANHVHKNLHALFMATALFDDDFFRALHERAGKLLWTQVLEQSLADGLHYERSPLYHAQVLADTEEAVALARAQGSCVPAAVEATLPGMLHALACLSRPDGTLHLFNDAGNEGERLCSLVRKAQTLPGELMLPRIWVLPEAGYYGYVSNRVRLVIDCGDPGPRHQPGHGHCDLLSYELDIDATPVIVDSGTSGYDADPLRAYMRSTRAHNTVQLGDLDQHEMWATFRIGGRATIHGAGMGWSDGAGIRFDGSYTRYCKGMTHARTIHVAKDCITVQDRIEHQTSDQVISFVHFHPDVEVAIEGNRIHIVFDKGKAVIEPNGMAALRVVKGRRDPDQGWYAARFGAAVAASVLEMTVAAGVESFGYRISF